MKNWKAKNNPLPDKTDNLRMKEFLRFKYVEKRFAVAESSEDSSDSEKERARRKKNKDKKKEKAKKSKKKADEDSSDEPAAQEEQKA